MKLIKSLFGLYSNRYLAVFGGGLGDVFNQLYQYYGMQSIPELIEYYNADIMCYCSVHNKAVVDLVKSIRLQNDNQVFNYYKFIPWVNNFNTKLLAMKLNRKLIPATSFKRGKYQVHTDLPDRNFFDGNMYEFKYSASAVELPDNYIVVHPSSGVQEIDGLKREDYAILINELCKLDVNVVAVGASHTRDWISSTGKVKEGPDYIENCIECNHNNFIDYTNKLTAPQSANVVLRADLFIGCHSCWMNLFTHFKKPVICVLAEQINERNWLQYIATDGCSWCFSMPWVEVVPVTGSINTEYNEDFNLNQTIGQIIKRVLDESS